MSARTASDKENEVVNVSSSKNTLEATKKNYVNSSFEHGERGEASHQAFRTAVKGKDKMMAITINRP